MKSPKKSVIILIVVLTLLLGMLAKQLLPRRKPLPKKAPPIPVAPEVKKEVPSEKEELEKKPLAPREGIPRRENPFTPLIGGISPEEERVLPERREVLVLTGVVMGREPMAIIEGPEGDYYVKVGEAIGSKKVIEIAPDSVVLLEGEKRITLKLRGE